MMRNDWLLPRTLMHWSGGKDSALALYRLQQRGQYTVTGLLTTVNEAYGRVSMHGVRRELIEAQAGRLQLPLTTLPLAEQVSMDEYSQLMHNTLQTFASAGVSHCGFGDIFLEDLRQWREAELAPLGLRGLFPLWQTDSRALLEEFWAAGFQTVIVAVNGGVLDASFCGRVLNRELVAELPPEVDPCGERGEFHTFVFDAPNFTQPIDYTTGETVERTYQFTDADGQVRTSVYYFTDLLPVP